MTTKKLVLLSLEKAVVSLDEVLGIDKTVIVRDATIQRFEYTYELCWKMMKRFLVMDEGREKVESLHRKDLFRLAAEKGLIGDAAAWFDFHQARNETSHTSEEERAEQVYEVARRFAPAARALLRELERRNDA